jgi:four helix bundle protein
MTNSPLQRKSFELSLALLDSYKYLKTERKEFILSPQLLRSGTAIGALIREAEYAQSKADFINKLSVSLKEANETEYWIDLLRAGGYLPIDQTAPLYYTLLEIKKMLIASVKTAKENK